MGLRSIVSIMAPVVLFGLVPGAGLAWGAARRLRWSPPTAIAAAFTFSMSLAGVAAWAGRVLGFGLDGVWWATLALSVAATAFAVLLLLRDRRTSASNRTAPANETPAEETPGFHAGWQGIVLSLIVGGVAFWQRPWFAYTPDTFYHLAAARSLMATGRPLVTDPLHGTATSALDPTSGIFHTWLALLGAHSSVQIHELFVGFTALAAAIVVLALWALAERLSKSPWAATLAAAGFAGLSLFADFRMLGFPNRFSVALVYLCIIALADLVEGRDRWWAVATVVLAGFGALAIHMASAALLVVSAAVIVIWAALAGVARRGTRGAWAPFIRIAVPLAVLAVLAAPLLMAKVGLVSGSDIVGSQIPEKARETALWFLGPWVVLVRPGQFVGGGAMAFWMTVFVGLVATWRALWKGDDSAIPAAGLLLMPALLLFDPITTSVLVHYSYYSLARVALLMSFVPWLALAWAVAAAVRGDGYGRARHVLAASAIALFVGHAATMYPYAVSTYTEADPLLRPGESYTVAESRQADVRDGWGNALWDVRVEIGDAYPRVAASAETGYYLAGLVPVAIVAAPESHSPLTVPDGWKRRMDMETLLAPDATADARREILETWDADYVALSPGINGDGPALESMREQTELFEPVVDTRRLALMRVLPAED